MTNLSHQHRSGLHKSTTAVFATLIAALFAAPLHSQDTPPAATVNGVPIAWRAVDQHLRNSIGNRNVSEDTRSKLREEARKHLIDRQLVLSALRKQSLVASDMQIKNDVARLTKRLQRSGQTLQSYLQTANLTAADLTEIARWKISWQAYLEKYLTDANLKRYFDKHRKDFDGTEIQIAHILLRAKTSDERTAAIRSAQSLREQITSGQLTFEDAAKRHSQSPTAASGGVMGKIRRHEPMPESFSQAAFALSENEISQPIATSFGIHLIQCQAIIPGIQTWQDNRADIETAVKAYLFRWLADRERASANISFTGE